MLYVIDLPKNELNYNYKIIFVYISKVKKKEYQGYAKVDIVKDKMSLDI